MTPTDTINLIINKVESITGQKVGIENGKPTLITISRTQEQENEFVKFLNELLNDKQHVNNLTEYPRLMKKKEFRNRFISNFLFIYGPKTVGEQ